MRRRRFGDLQEAHLFVLADRSGTAAFHRMRGRLQEAQPQLIDAERLARSAALRPRSRMTVSSLTAILAYVEFLSESYLTDRPATRLLRRDPGLQ